MAPRKQLTERAKELQKDESWMAQVKETKEWVEQLQLEVENQKREFLPVQTVDDVIDNARYAEEVLKANGKYYNATEMAKLLGAKSAAALNIELQNAGIIYKTNGSWVMAEKYDNGRLSVIKTGVKKGKSYSMLLWTEQGRKWLHNLQRRGIIVTDPVPRKKSKKYLLDTEELKTDLDELKRQVDYAKEVTEHDRTKCMIIIGDMLDISASIQERISNLLRDLGMIDADEPFTNLLCQGMVKDENGDTMSKSKGNVVPPSSVIGPFGADTMRLVILFIAPPEKDFDWDEKAVAGANRFIKRAWSIVWQLSEGAQAGDFDYTKLDGQAAELFRTLNGLGARCTADYDRAQFNTAISAVMEIVNAASKYLIETPADERNHELDYRVAHDIVAILAPICPHWAEELYHEALHLTGSVYNEPWPEFDVELSRADTVEIAVQVMGKVRARVNVAVDASREDLEKAALEAVASQIEGKTVRKVVVVPGKLVNVVAN